MKLKSIVQGILLGIIVGLAALIVLALISCSPKVYPMPEGCKPPKQKEYKMIEPEPTIKRKDESN